MKNKKMIDYRKINLYLELNLTELPTINNTSICKSDEQNIPIM